MHPFRNPKCTILSIDCYACGSMKTIQKITPTNQDYYLQDPSRLNGQPKAEIGNYVKANGILVPKFSVTLRGAALFRGRVIARSECVQDYDGASGLANSPILSGVESFSNENEFKQALLKMDQEELQYNLKFSNMSASCKILDYCRFLGLNKDEFLQGLSFSYWEYVYGLNRIVTADSAIASRYHVITRSSKRANYSIVDNGEIIDYGEKFGKQPLPPDLSQALNGLIATYEKIRNLERFDPNHCPIMEFVTSEGKDYFLQYHRGRDFSPVEFVLDRPARAGEFEASFVRGATNSRQVKLSVQVRDTLNESEECSMFLKKHESNVLDELMTRRRGVQFIEGGMEDVIDRLSRLGHMSHSLLFKPAITLSVDLFKLLKPEEYAIASKDYGRDFYTDATFSVVSDGRKSYIQRID